MPTPGFLRSLVELARYDALDALLDNAVTLLERELLKPWIQAVG